MQQCQIEAAVAVRQPHVDDGLAMPPHRSLLLLGARGGGRASPRLARRVLDRLLAPAAQVEGVDFHLGDPGLPIAAAGASGYALLAPPLGNLSNRFYAVHPRRNDRFVAARAPLRALFPEVDFTHFAFTGHALGTLAATCPERFAELRRDLNAAWLRRMERLLAVLPPHGVLIDLPAPGWLPRPPVPGARLLSLDPDDRATGAERFCAALKRL